MNKLCVYGCGWEGWRKTERERVAKPWNVGASVFSTQTQPDLENVRMNVQIQTSEKMNEKTGVPGGKNPLVRCSWYPNKKDQKVKTVCNQGYSCLQSSGEKRKTNVGEQSPFRHRYYRLSFLLCILRL